MKKLVPLFLALMSVNAFAAASPTAMEDAKDFAQKARVSDPCAAKILAEATQKCDRDSKSDQGREHECFYNYDDAF